MLRSWLPWTLAVVVLIAAAFAAGFIMGGRPDPPAARVLLPESESDLLSEVERLREELAIRRRAGKAAAERAAELQREVARLREAGREDGERLDGRSGTPGDESGRVIALRDRVDTLERELAAARQEAAEAATAAEEARNIRARVRESVCRALAEALPASEALPAVAPQAGARVETTPSNEQRKLLAEGVLAYECTDYRGAFRRWLPLAQTGYPRAQFHVGALFYEGRGVDRDDALAYAWLSLAARHDVPAAEPLLDDLRARLDDAGMSRARRLIGQGG